MSSIPFVLDTVAAASATWTVVVLTVVVWILGESVSSGDASAAGIPA